MTSSLIDSILKKLKEDTPAKFGIMTPQHMVEHLTITLKISSGRIQLPEFEPSEKVLQFKELLLHTEMDFPQGIKAPMSQDGPPPLRFPDLDMAKQKLLESIDEYEKTFEQNPDLLTVHPRFNLLDKKEWDLFHQKHFKHHFTQFGIWD